MHLTCTPRAPLRRSNGVSYEHAPSSAHVALGAKSTIGKESNNGIRHHRFLPDPVRNRIRRFLARLGQDQLLETLTRSKNGEG